MRLKGILNVSNQQEASRNSNNDGTRVRVPWKIFHCFCAFISNVMTRSFKNTRSCGVVRNTALL
jgi:hypothetical protein